MARLSLAQLQIKAPYSIMTETMVEPTILVSSDVDRHFRTDHLDVGMKRRSIWGGAVTLCAQVVKFLLQMGSTAVLARLLTPVDFGLIAMVAGFTGLIGLFSDMGLSAATVQRSTITHQQVSTLFWINIAVSLTLAGTGAAAAPAVAWFYGEPRLVWITVAISASLVFSGLTAQHYALLVRQMRFGAMAFVQTVPLMVGILVGIELAVAGWGYWSLVVMGVVQGGGTALAAWIASGWRPGLPCRGNGVRSMLAFGGHLTGFNLLSYFTRNGDNVLIGRFLGSAPLGIYTKAYGLLMMPIQQINAPVNGVILPVLSRLQGQPDRFRSYFLKAVESLAFIGMPFITFAFVDAEPLVLVLLGPKWKAAAPIFRLLTPAALVGTVNLAPTWIFTTLERADRQFLWAIISTPVILAGFVAGLIWGAEGVAASFSITFVLCFVLFTADACRHSPIRFRDFVGAVVPPFCLSVAAASALLVCHRFSHHFPATMRVALDTISFATSYGIVCMMLPNGRAFVRTLIWHYGHVTNRVL